MIDMNYNNISHNPIMEQICDLESVEMEALLRRFNKDKLNGRVSMIEFIEELTCKTN